MDNVYEKPEVLRTGYHPETIEAGCCLKSCGGSPRAIQEGDILKEEFLTIKKQLKKLCKDVQLSHVSANIIHEGN